MTDRIRVSLRLSKAFLSEIDCIAMTERRTRAEVLKLLLRMASRNYRRRRALLCDGPDCARRCCAQRGESQPGNLCEFPSGSPSP